MDRTIDDDIAAFVIAEFTEALDDFFARRGDAKAIASRAATGAAVERDRWTALCGIGLTALRVGEPRGLGANLRAATAVAEKLGAVLVPEPASTTIIVAHALDRYGGPTDLRDSIVDGSRIVSCSDFTPVTLTTANAVIGHVEVADDELCDLVAVLADSALVIVERSALRAGAERCGVDPTRPTVRCDLDGTPAVTALRLPAVAMTGIADELKLMLASELAGGMGAVLEETIGYVRERKQFGRIIGGFQAVKHTLADLYANTEQASAAVQFAAISCDQGRDSASADVAAAARWVTRAAIDTFDRALHLHGAMGYSWELDVHLQLRRALSIHQMLSRQWDFVA